MTCEDKPIDALFSSPEPEHDTDHTDRLFEQYKIYLQMLDSLTHRRTLANSFFLSMNTGLLAALGLFGRLGVSSEIDNLWIVTGFGAGIVFSYSWYRTVRSYKQLSVVKWGIILEIEKRLPIPIHSVEWKLLGEGKDRKTYTPLTHVETTIPCIFAIVYTVLASIVVSTLDTLTF